MNIKHDIAIKAARLEELQPGQKLTYTCGSVAAYQAALRNAYAIRKTRPRADGYDYKIESNANRATVTVSLVKRES